MIDAFSRLPSFQEPSLSKVFPPTWESGVLSISAVLPYSSALWTPPGNHTLIIPSLRVFLRQRGGECFPEYFLFRNFERIFLCRTILRIPHSSEIAPKVASLLFFKVSSVLTRTQTSLLMEQLTYYTEPMEELAHSISTCQNHGVTEFEKIVNCLFPRSEMVVHDLQRRIYCP